MNRSVALAIRFTAAAIEEALARRRSGLNLDSGSYSARVEVAYLLQSIAEQAPLGLDPNGTAARLKAELDRLPPGEPLSRVETVLELEGIERDILRVLIAWSLDARIATLFGHVHDALQSIRPTAGALADVLRAPADVALALAPEAKLRRTQLVVTDRFGADAALGIDPRIAAFAATGSLPALETDDCSAAIDRAPLVPESAERVAPFHSVDVLIARGPLGSGRKSVARALSAQEARPLLLVETGSEPKPASIALVLRDAKLLGARAGFTKPLPEAALRRIAEEKDAALAFVFAERASIPEALLGRRLTVIDLEIPRAAERRTLWSQLLSRGEGDAEVARAAERYAFTPGLIKQAALQAQRGTLDAACRMQLNHGLEEIAVRGTPSAAWDRLVLPKSALDSLRAACAQARQRQKVEDEWGFGSFHRLGRGLKLLFHGRSGTGKTLAAEIMGRELELPIYRIDLARLVSKWIGETEKNLSQLFEQAERAHALLFFDEADALFSKRTGVSSSTDRYANMEVNHLLQRIEEHQGVLILATNLKSNFDPAFARRLHYVVEFPDPDAEARERIWRLSIPPNAPLSPELNFRELARRFELSGGAIKNIVCGAAYLAAEEEQPIRTQHVAAALRREMAKMDRLLQRGEIEALLAPPS